MKVVAHTVIHKSFLHAVIRSAPVQVRQLLDEEGGPGVKVVAQIDTGAAIRAYDDILKVADAIMISRTNLGMVIRPEKVSAGADIV